MTPLQRLLIVALIAFGVGSGSGWTARTWYGASRALSETRTSIATTERENTRRRAIGAQHARDQRAIQEHFDAEPDAVDQMVAERPALAGCELGPDGLRAWNSWNEGPVGADRRRVAGEGPDETPAGEERPDVGPRREPQDVRAAVPRGGDPL